MADQVIFRNECGLNADILGERTGMRGAQVAVCCSSRWLSACVRQVDWPIKVELDTLLPGRGHQRVYAEGRNVVTK